MDTPDTAHEKLEAKKKCEVHEPPFTIKKSDIIADGIISGGRIIGLLTPIIHWNREFPESPDVVWLKSPLTAIHPETGEKHPDCNGFWNIRLSNTKYRLLILEIEGREDHTSELFGEETEEPEPQK